MSFVMAEVRQAGKPLAVAHLAFGASRPGSLTQEPLAMPDVVDPSHEPSDFDSVMPEFFREQFEVRRCDRTARAAGAMRAHDDS